MMTAATSVTVRVDFAGKRRGGTRPPPRERVCGAAEVGGPPTAPETGTDGGNSGNGGSASRPRQRRRRKPAPIAREQVDRIARRLALAHLVDRMIDAGEIGSYAEAARRIGVSKSRLSQVMEALGMTREEQEAVLLGDAGR